MSQQKNYGIPADVRDRVMAAAAKLFDASNQTSMPTVDMVRREARVDMNVASSVMREWRRAQMAQINVATVEVPEAVQQAMRAALGKLWEQAQELASDSLRSAQTAWDLERSELDVMRQEISDAFETQSAELEAVRADLALRDKQLAEQAKDLEVQKTELIRTQARLEAAEQGRDAAAQAAAEARERAAGLAGQLTAMQDTIEKFVSKTIKNN